MKYVQTARSSEHGTAKIPLYDENDNVINKVSIVDSGSFLKFLDNSKTTDYSDISGTTVKMVISIDKDGIVDTTTDTVEILRTQGNYVIVLKDDSAYSIYSGVAKFYKI